MSVNYKAEYEKVLFTTENSGRTTIGEAWNTKVSYVQFPPRPRPGGPLFLNPSSGSFLRSEQRVGKTVTYSSTNGVSDRAEYPFYCPQGGLYYPSDDVDGQVNSKILKDLQKHSQSFADHIGENGETSALLLQAARIFFECLQLARGKIPPRWARLTKRAATRHWTIRDVSVAWIVGSFVVSPILQTINDYCYQQSGIPNRKILRIRHSSQATNVYQVKNSTYGFQQTCDLKIIKTAYFDVDTGSASFTAGNVLEWVWAATPFSFVVDWMFKVSQFLTQLNGIPKGFRMISGTQVSIVKAENIFNVYPQQKNASQVFPAVDKYFSLSRGVLSSIGMPAYPRWKPSNKGGVLVTAIALLHVLRRS